MKKAVNGFKILIFIVLVAALFLGVTSYTARKTYNERRANEHFTEVDRYSMDEFCLANTQAVMEALQSGQNAQLEKLMAEGMEGGDDVDKLIEFADWENADFAAAVSMGSGSLMAKPDKNGRMDVSERSIVKIGKKEYIIFVETLTSRWGRTNEGVSAIGITTFKHFDNLDYGWNGEKDEHSVLMGKLFWKKNKA